MSSLASNDGDATLVFFLPGGYHNSWCFDRVIKHLETLDKEKRFEKIGIDYPRTLPPKPSNDLSVYADHCVKVIQERYQYCAQNCTKNESNINVILIGHSMAGILLPNIVQQLYKVNKNKNIITSVVFIASLIFSSNECMFDILKQMQSKKQPSFQAAKVKVINNDEHKMIDQELANDLFYKDCSKSDALEAYSKLIPETNHVYKYSAKYDKKLLDSIPKMYIQTKYDQCIKLFMQDGMCRKIGFQKIVTMHCGHSPFLVSPKFLAYYLNDWILKQIGLKSTNETHKVQNLIDYFDWCQSDLAF